MSDTQTTRPDPPGPVAWPPTDPGRPGAAGRGWTRLDAAAQRLHGDSDGGGGEHSGSLLLRPSRSKKYAKSTSRTLPAGSSFTGYVLFDVPRGFTAGAVELHADGETRGVRIEFAAA